MLHKLDRFYHYCFAKEVYVITDQEQLVAMVNNDVVHILLAITVHNAVHPLI